MKAHITLENLEIAAEHVRWCRSQGLTYEQIMTQLNPLHRGASSAQKCILRAARLNADDQQRIRLAGWNINYLEAA